MIARTVGIALAAMLVGAPAEARAAEIVTTVEFLPLPPEPSTTEIVVTDDAGSVQVEKTGSGWRYKLIQPNRLFGIVIVNVQGYPTGYSFDPIKLQIPFYFEADLDLTLLVTKVDADRTAVENLLSDSADMSRVSVSSLFKLYQRARAITEKRLATLEQEGRNVHAYDLKAAYVMLQSAREVYRRRYVLPDSFVVKGKDWLRTQIADQPALVQRTLRVDPSTKRGNAEILLDDLDSLEAQYLQNLFDSIRELPKDQSSRGCDLFKGLQEVLLRIRADPERVKPIRLTVERLSVNVSSAVAKCLNDSVVSNLSAVQTMGDDAAGLVSIESDLRTQKILLENQVDVLREVSRSTENEVSPEGALRLRELQRSLENIAKVTRAPL